MKNLLVVIIGLIIVGCGGQLKILKNTPNKYTQPIKLYITEKDYTGGIEKFELTKFSDRLEPVFKDKSIGVKTYYKDAESGEEAFYLDFYDNPFEIIHDSTSANIIAKIEISVLEYAKRKDIESALEGIGREMMWGGLSRFFDNERLGHLFADCTIIDAQSGEEISFISFISKSDKGFSKKKSLDNALDKGLDSFIREFLAQ